MKKSVNCFVVFILMMLIVMASCASTDKAAKNTDTGPKLTVAILDFQVLSGNKADAFLSESAASDLQKALLESGKFQPVERQKIEKAIEELAFSQSNLADESKSIELGKFLGARFLVMGSIIKVGSDTKINCRMIETETTKIIMAESVRGKSENLLDLIEQLSALIKSKV